MDKLTAIRIKYDDGTYSGEIPISAIAENIQWDSTHNLVDVLGSIALNTKGSVQDQLSQLFNTKVDTTNLSNYINTNLKTDVEDWLDENVNPVGGVVALDSSLSISGAAADAKATGDGINAIAAVSDTQPVSEFNHIWVKETPQTETQVPTYNEFLELKNEVDDLESDLNEVAVIQKNNNLFNLDGDFTQGFIQEDGTISTIGSYSNYSTSDFIELDQSKSYKVAMLNINTSENVSTVRRGFLLYNASKQIIANSYKNGHDVYTVTGAQFIRMSVETVYLGTSTFKPVIQEGEFLQPYEPYGATVSFQNLVQETGDSEYSIMSQKAVTEAINNGVSEANKFTSEAIVYNYADIVALNDGYMGTDGYIYPSASNYKYTDKISVETGETFYTGKARMVTFFKGNDVSTSDGLNYSDDTVTSHSFTIPQGVTDMVISLYASDTNKFISKVDSGGKLFTEKAQTEIRNIISDYGELSLIGKKWWACGDSFTEWTTEEYAPSDVPNVTGLSHYKTYPYWIGKRTGMTVYNFAVSGQTMAMPANPGSFTNAFANNKYKNIPSDVDYITLKFGINDSHHAPGSSGGDGEDNTGVIPIGDITDTGTATFCGAYNTVLEYLIANHPFAKIGILVSNGCDTDEYRQKTIAIAEKWGLPYLDENGEARCPALIRSSNVNVSNTLKQMRLEAWAANYPNNTHPNVNAHEYESTIVEAFLKSL